MRKKFLPLSRRPQISLLVPWRFDPRAPERAEIVAWTLRYWRHALPDAEIIIGKSRGKVFSKTAAVNNAARRAKGRVFVIMDADAYMRADVIKQCADRIDQAVARGRRLWFVPYRHLYRLNARVSREILRSNPRHPLQLPQPPHPEDIINSHGSMHGHRFGALVQVMPREAFWAVGGMDPRFRGWGGEDVAFMHAVDTLYGQHKTTRNDVLHIWHRTIGSNNTDRKWAGQVGHSNNMRLATRYNRAIGDPKRMRALVLEGHPTIRTHMKLWIQRGWTWLQLPKVGQ